MPRKVKVYVAVEGVEYEGYDVVGVYRTPEKAHEALSNTKGYHDYVEIQVFSLDGERLYNDPDEYFAK